MTAAPPACVPEQHHDDAPAGRRLPAWLVPTGLSLAVAGLLGGLFLGRGMAAAGAERVTDEGHEGTCTTPQR